MSALPPRLRRPSSGRHARVVLGGLLGVAALLLSACTAARSAIEQDVVDPRTGPVDTETSYSFLSSPDFLNADIADVRSSPLYRPGSPNSITPSLRKSLDTVLDHLASEHVPDIFVAGDLVEGHWGVDTENTGTFGPVGTRAERRQAIVRAGHLYYQAWLRGFSSRGIRTFPALGDHDIGDNNWGLDAGPYARFKQHNLELWKQVYSRNVLRNPDGTRRFPDHPSGPAAGTAYAVRPDPEVLLVSLDVFQHTRTDVHIKVDDLQLAWLKRVLAAAVADGVDWIIVQGHTPIVTPVPMVGSSGLMYQNGVDSPLWRTMRNYGVDLYLCGEVHATSMHHVDGITQVCHGGLFAYGFSNYVRADIDGGTLTMTSNRFLSEKDKSVRLWQTNMRKAMPAQVVYEPEPVVRGTLTVTSDNRVVTASGNLREYLP